MRMMMMMMSMMMMMLSILMNMRFEIYISEMLSNWNHIALIDVYISDTCYPQYLFYLCLWSCIVTKIYLKYVNSCSLRREYCYFLLLFPILPECSHNAVTCRSVEAGVFVNTKEYAPSVR